MRKPSRRKCKVCGEYFVPKFHDIRIRWCSPEHGAILAMEERKKEKVKAAAKRIKEQKEAEKDGANAARSGWQSSGQTDTTRLRLRKLSTPLSVRATPICHASAAARPIRLICMVASGIAAISRQ